MEVTRIILCGVLTTCVCASGVADIVLSCELMEDSVGLHMSSGFPSSPATLILRDVFVDSHESLEVQSPFVPLANPDPRAIMFESNVSSFKIPNINVVLHADCNEQEVTCKISKYALKERSESDYFLVSIDVKDGAFGTLLILRAMPPADDQSSQIHMELGLPLSQTGTLLTEVSFLVFSAVNSVSAPLRGASLLSCGFNHRDMAPDEEMHIEWRQQYRGFGQKILKMAARLNDTQGGAAEVRHWSKDSSMDASQVVSEGNASVTLSNLKVTDEGAYICSVAIGPFSGQQVIKLQVLQAPSVSLSEEEKLVLKGNTAQTLSCHCRKYYPLEAKVEWLSHSPTDEEPAILADQGSMSSHQKHSDGTYSLSSRLVVPTDVAPGTRITCRVSHVALDASLSVSVLVEHPEADDYWWVLSLLVITVVFFYQLIN
ncbi:tapasin-related protein isoform X2 [Syngnathus scovelli]|uniref:tapasin-related protein isoform X2 n=1 Tax=Syngnathus scovelli TaxID=161590 RepID=UPI00210FFC1F|nr:tapasin-related protein isoform X2 [Syngnathus scovelli]